MIRLNEIKVPVTSDSYDYLLKKVSNRLNVSKEDVKEIKIIKKSIDARNKSNILFNYELNISINNEDRIKNISKVSEEHYKCPLTPFPSLPERRSKKAFILCGFPALLLSQQTFVTSVGLDIYNVPKNVYETSYTSFGQF